MKSMNENYYKEMSIYMLHVYNIPKFCLKT